MTRPILRPHYQSRRRAAWACVVPSSLSLTPQPYGGDAGQRAGMVDLCAIMRRLGHEQAAREAAADYAYTDFSNSRHNNPSPVLVRPARDDLIISLLEN